MFRLSIVTDEVAQGFPHALEVIDGYGIRHVELRTLWNKNIVSLSNAEVREAQSLLQAHGMKAILIDGPIFKCDIDEACPTDNVDSFFSDRLNFDGHLDLLRRAIELAHEFEAPMVRVFTFWRQDTAWERMAERFQRPLELAAEAGLTLALENIGECNVATSNEIVRFFDLLHSPHIGLIWDPGNAFWAGEARPYPDGYAAVKKHVIHVHVKDMTYDPDTGQPVTCPVGQGKIEYLGQFQALAQAGYEGFLSLEPEFTPAGGTPEDGTHQSWERLQMILSKISVV